MKPDGPTKLLIRDDEGVVVAYTRDGTVYDVMSGERIAKLRAGQLYTADDQLLGICLPSGKVRGVGGEPAAAFMKLIRREALNR
jgi:hypothetical protein